MTGNKEVHSVEVFAGTINEAIIVKSLLENSEIDSFLKDEIQGSMAPWVVAPGGAGPVKIVVSSVDAEAATLVVEEFMRNRTEETIED